jgi:hypothetical protein
MSDVQGSSKCLSIFDLHFPSGSEVDSNVRAEESDMHDLRTGVVLKGRLKAKGDLENWVDHLFRATDEGVGEDTAAGTIKAWQAVHVCEDTNTLIWCCNRIVCLLKDYKRFFQDPSQEPECFAAYRITYSRQNAPGVLNVLRMSGTGGVRVRRARVLWRQCYQCRRDAPCGSRPSQSC